MGNVPDTIQTWQMIQPFKKDRETGEVTPGKLEKPRFPCPNWGRGMCWWKWPGAASAIRIWAISIRRAHGEQTAADVRS